MIVALADIYAQIPLREEVRELMVATQARIRQQPGCVSYEFTESLEDPGHFVAVQEWRDEHAMQEHFRSQAFADYQAQIADRLVRSSELRVHDVASSYAPFDSSPLATAQDD